MRELLPNRACENRSSICSRKQLYMMMMMMMMMMMITMPQSIDVISVT